MENPLYWVFTGWAVLIAVVSLYYIIELGQKVREVHFQE